MVEFFVAPLIRPFLRFGWDGFRMMLLSSVTVAIAAFVLPYAYLDILSPIAFFVHSEAILFVHIAGVLAPFFEELVKVSLQYKAKMLGVTIEALEF